MPPVPPSCCTVLSASSSNDPGPPHPMSLQETCSYIDHHTARCGRPTSIFADDAKADIHRHAGGLPRLVNALCYRSILDAAANDTRIIGSSNIVSDDLFD